MILHHSNHMIEKILEQERAKSNFCPNKLGSFLYGEPYYTHMKTALQSGPVLRYTPNLYNKSRLELIKDSYRYLPLSYNFVRNHLTAGYEPH